MPHHRARFTARGRWDVVRRVVELEETFAQAAAWANVSKSTVWEWVRRWRQASAERAGVAGVSGRALRAARTAHRRRVPAEEAQRICALRERTGWSPRRLADEPEIARSHSTVHRVLQRAGVSRRPRPERPAVVRYLWPCPGQLLHMDTKKLGKFTEPGHASPATARGARGGSAGSTCTRSSTTARRLAYSEIHDDETAVTVTAFTEPGAGLLPRARDRRRAADDRQRVRLHPQPLACASCWLAARSATSARGPTRHAPTARSSATSRHSNANGPTRSNTPQAPPAGPRCHTGCATTTSGAPTAPSATAPRSHAFGRSPGSTASARRRA